MVGLEQYGVEPFKQQQFGTAGIQEVKKWSDDVLLQCLIKGVCFLFVCRLIFLAASHASRHKQPHDIFSRYKLITAQLVRPASHKPLLSTGDEECGTPPRITQWKYSFHTMHFPVRIVFERHWKCTYGKHKHTRHSMCLNSGLPQRGPTAWRDLPLSSLLFYCNQICVYFSIIFMWYPTRKRFSF